VLWERDASPRPAPPAEDRFWTPESVSRSVSTMLTVWQENTARRMCVDQAAGLTATVHLVRSVVRGRRIVSGRVRTAATSAMIVPLARSVEMEPAWILV